MLSKFVEIAQRENLHKLTGLTTKEMQLFFFLLISPDEEFSTGNLIKQIEAKLKIRFNFTTLSRCLKKLENYRIITWIRPEKFHRHEHSSIWLNNMGIDILGVKSQVQEMLAIFENIENKVKFMKEKEITDELIELAKENAGATLYLRLLLARGTFDEEQANLGLIIQQVYTESRQDAYIEEVKRRGDKSMNDVLEYFKNYGSENV